MEKKTKLERKYQSDLIKTLNVMVGSNGYVLNLDGSYIQGFPDILILYKDKWAALECKRTSASDKQPNQDYYVRDLDRLSFSSFIYPGNENEVLHDLQQALRIRGPRVPQS